MKSRSMMGFENRGAKEVFQDAGVIVLSNNKIPEGKKIRIPGEKWEWYGWVESD